MDCSAVPDCIWGEPDETCQEIGHPAGWILLAEPGGCWPTCWPHEYCKPDLCICNEPPDVWWPCHWGVDCPDQHKCTPYEDDGGVGLCEYIPDPYMLY
jgi:hypothetical protein